MSTRRQFIKQAALATGGILTATSSWGHFLLPKKRKVIIIGGGFAGLSAALSLHQRHIDFELLEAGADIGGRVLSHKIDPQQQLVVELGAEWVGEDHAMICGLCERFGLALENNQFNSRAIYKNRYYERLDDLMPQDWEQKYSALIRQYQDLDEAHKEAAGRLLDKTDWWRYLISQGCDDTALDLRDLLDSTDFGETIREVSAYVALDEYARSSMISRNEMDLKIKGGNQQLAYTIAALFPEKIKKNCRVTKVVQNGEKVQVHCADGSVVTGDKIICTIPTFALQKITWQPQLPASMTYAIDALQYARINKHALLFSERFWKDESFDLITDMPAHYIYHATKNQQSAKGALISYTIGDKAAVAANQTDDWYADMFQQSLNPNPSFAHIKPMIEGHARCYWGNRDYVRGSYAIYGKGQWFDLFDKLNTPHINTHFAGEHLSPNWGGFMEGALETGRTAAENILS
jgi:monoamine oxidase